MGPASHSGCSADVSGPVFTFGSVNKQLDRLKNPCDHFYNNLESESVLFKLVRQPVSESLHILQSGASFNRSHTVVTSLCRLWTCFDELTG